MTSCLGDTLSVMTERNKKILEDDLDQHYDTRQGNTDYIVGLEKAYEFFTNSKADLSRPGFNESLRIILFLSDGNPTANSEKVCLGFEFPHVWKKFNNCDKIGTKFVFFYFYAVD